MIHFVKDSKRNVIGVDVAKKKLDIFDWHSKEHFIVPNENEAIETFVQLILHSRKETLVVMEATGGYESLIVKQLHQHNVSCAVVNAFQVRSFARGCGKLAKNDKIDAQMIAFFGTVVDPKPQEKQGPNEQKLKALVHRRNQLISMVVQENNRMQQTEDSQLQELIDQILQALGKQRKAVEKQIEELIDQCQSQKRIAEIVSSCKGVGKVTTAVLITELPELGQLNRQEIAKLVGVAPFVKDSGQSQGQRSIYGGRSPVRRVLYMATIVAVTHNRRIREYYLHLVKKGKPKKVAIIASMRKLLVILNTMVKNDKKWCENQLADLTS